MAKNSIAVSDDKPARKARKPVSAATKAKMKRAWAERKAAAGDTVKRGPRTNGAPETTIDALLSAVSKLSTAEIEQKLVGAKQQVTLLESLLSLSAAAEPEKAMTAANGDPFNR